MFQNMKDGNVYSDQPDQGLCQGSETGCPELAIVIFFGILFE